MMPWSLSRCLLIIILTTLYLSLLPCQGHAVRAGVAFLSSIMTASARLWAIDHLPHTKQAGLIEPLSGFCRNAPDHIHQAKYLSHDIIILLQDHLDTCKFAAPTPPMAARSNYPGNEPTCWQVPAQTSEVQVVSQKCTGWIGEWFPKARVCTMLQCVTLHFTGPCKEWLPLCSWVLQQRLWWTDC
jgi:hypothetical protein